MLNMNPQSFTTTVTVTLIATATYSAIPSANEQVRESVQLRIYRPK